MTRLLQRTRSRLVRDGPAAALVPFWLLVAWADRGYQSDAWLGMAAWLTVLALEIAFIAWMLRARPPDRTCQIILAIFAGYALWVALSAIWAVDQAPALEAAALAGFYLVFLALAFLALSQPRWRVDMRPSLLGAGVFMVVLALAGILAIGAKSDLSAGWRFGFPLGYINVAGTFYLLLFWPLLWLAADPQRRRWHRAVGLGTAAALLQAALLTQSRGAMLGLVVGGVFYFLLSPARVRSLVFLLAPAGLLALSFPTIDAYWTQGPDTLGRLPAFSWVAGAWLAATAIGLGLAWSDERIHMGRRLRLALSVVVAAALLGGAALGALWFEREVGDVPAWVRETASSFVGEEAVYDPGSEESRFTQGGSGGRGTMWRTAWKGFLDAPVIGNGAGSFPRVEERYGRVPDTDRSQAHSLEMDLLSETGVVGMVLFMAWFGVATVAGFGAAPHTSARRTSV